MAFRTERRSAPDTTPASDDDVVARRGAHPRHVLRRYLSERPSLYLPLARRRYPGPSPMVVTRDTDLVIDGYTRSATTYAVYAFQVAQPRPVRLAHHLHAPAQILAAARWGIPTILLIRDPEGAVLSQVVREPGVTVRDALVSWRRFYEVTLRRPGAFVVGEFAQVTTDMGRVTRDLNERFGTSFAEFERTRGHEREVLELMGNDRPRSPSGRRSCSASSRVWSRGRRCSRRASASGADRTAARDRRGSRRRNATRRRSGWGPSGPIVRSIGSGRARIASMKTWWRGRISVPT